MKELQTKISKERAEFMKRYEEMNPLDVYKYQYVIGFYESYYEMLMTEFYEDDDIYKWLCKFEKPLSFLYDEWLKSDRAFNHDWDEMWDFIEVIYTTRKGEDNEN